jgi:iron complex outermembrane recepter protein
MDKQPVRLAWLSTALVSAFVSAQQVATESPPGDAASGAIEEIVVTAQKRAENLQQVSAAITAVTGSTLAVRDVTSVEELSSVAPSVNFGAYGGIARIAVRGIGFDTVNPGSEGRVAFNLDGVYISRPSAQMGTFFDVDRVEVLRGPQGTLYGRNATGGSINVIPNGPTHEASGYADVTVGNYGRVGVDAALSGSLASDLTGRVAVSTDAHKGYGTDTYLGQPIDDENTHAVRAILRYEPGETFRLTMSADYFGENDHAYGNHYFGVAVPGSQITGVVLGGVTPTNFRDSTSDVEPEDNREFYGTSLNAEYDLESVKLQSLSAYRQSSYDVLTDLDQTNLPLTLFQFSESAHQISEELRASGNVGRSKWNVGRSKWIVGLYYFNEHIQGGSQVALSLALFGVPSGLKSGYAVAGATHTEAEAVYGQLDLALTNKLSLILGSREGYEAVSIVDNSQYDLQRNYVPSAPLNDLPGFPRSASTHDDAFTPKLGLEYQATSDVLLYATASKGFKSGGFDVGVNEPAFKPETLWSYEGGIKATTFNDRLRTNFSGFYYDYRNLQVSVVNNNVVLTENAASAELYGAEFEYTAIPVDNLQFDGSVSYLFSQYLKYNSLDPSQPQLGVQNLTGKELTEAPRYTVNFGSQYKWSLPSGKVTVRGEFDYTARTFFTAYNYPAVSQGAYGKVNAFLVYDADGGHWQGSLYGRNLTNKTTIAGALISSAAVGSPITGNVAPPRTFGFKVSYRF